MTDTISGKPWLKRHIRSLIKLIGQHTPNPTYGAEVGVWKGQTSAALGAAFPGLHMIMVDEWKAHPPGSVYYDKHAVMGRLTQEEWHGIYNEAMSNTYSMKDRCTVIRHNSQVGAVPVGCGLLDFVFLDANHMYAEVKQDIETWAPKVRKGGLIMGHDYKCRHDLRGLWGVSKAVHEIYGQRRVMVGSGYVWAVIKK